MFRALFAAKEGPKHLFPTRSTFAASPEHLFPARSTFAASLEHLFPALFAAAESPQHLFQVPFTSTASPEHLFRASFAFEGSRAPIPKDKLRAEPLSIAKVVAHIVGDDAHNVAAVWGEPHCKQGDKRGPILAFFVVK